MRWMVVMALATGLSMPVGNAWTLAPADPRPDLAVKLGPGQAVVWSLSHSGGAFRTASTLLVFDYIRVTERTGGERKDFLEGDEFPGLDVVVFVTHGHRDHFDPVVLEWSDRVPRIHYVVSEDVTRRSGFETRAPSRRKLTVLSADERATLLDDRLDVRTVRSADEGVAYWVTVDGLDVVHTGDHALWGWKEDRFEATRESYLAELRKFASLRRRPDIAFLCADLRVQGPARLSGAPDAIALLDPVLALAIHNYGSHHEAATALHAAVENSRTFVADVRRHGDGFRYPPGD